MRLALPLFGTTINALVLAIPPYLIAGQSAVLDTPVLAFLILVSCWCFLEILMQPTSRPELTRGVRYRQLPGTIGLVLLALFWAGLVQRVYQPLPVNLLNWLGLTAMVSGITLRLLSIRTLGGHFLDEIALKPDQPIIMSGIYRYLRHPSEAGLLLIALGTAAWLGSSLALVIFTTTLLPLSLWRSLLEDRLLLSHDPQTFKTFSDAAPGLVPRHFLKYPLDSDSSVDPGSYSSS